MNYRTTVERRGATAILMAVLTVPLLGLLAFAVDYGYLLYLRTDMQRVADQAALAAVRELVPDPFGDQNLDTVRDVAKEYVERNFGEQYTVNDSDITIGRFEPSTIYSGNPQILTDGIADTVRITLRQDEDTNGSITLYFARLLDKNQQDLSVVSTAALQKARYLAPGTDLLPIAISTQAWNRLDPGDEISIYGDGRLTDDRNKAIPGNWGTIDVGANSNSTRDLKDQISNGLSQSDLNDLHRQGTIPTSEYIDSQLDIEVNGDTGFSGGLKNALEPEVGNTKLIPIHKGNLNGKGGNLSLEVVEWGVVTITNVHFKGGKSSRLKVQKAYIYDQDLRPQLDLSDTSDVIEGAYTGSVLIQ